jgi:hypothetical protein
MNREDFIKSRTALREIADAVGKSKGRDYAGEVDVLDNFKQAAVGTGMTKYQCWSIYFHKHVSAIMNSIKANPAAPQVESEPLAGRIVDCINYLQLLNSMLEEEGESAK